MRAQHSAQAAANWQQAQGDRSPCRGDRADASETWPDKQPEEKKCLTYQKMLFVRLKIGQKRQLQGRAVQIRILCDTICRDRCKGGEQSLWLSYCVTGAAHHSGTHFLKHIITLICKSVTVYWRGNYFRVFQRIISPINVRQILQAKCWHLKTSKEKHTNCVFSYNDITKYFSKLKGWPYQSLINQSLLRKSVFGSSLRKTLLLEITHLRGDECQRETMRLNRA